MRILVNGVMYLLFLVSVEVNKNAILVCLYLNTSQENVPCLPLLPVIACVNLLPVSLSDVHAWSLVKQTKLSLLFNFGRDFITILVCMCCMWMCGCVREKRGLIMLQPSSCHYCRKFLCLRLCSS